MKKFAPYMLAAAAVTMVAASAEADHDDRGNDPVFLSQQVEQDAYLLVQILARGGPANTQLIQNGGMVAKDANDLTNSLTGRGNGHPEQEFHEVLRAFDLLSDAFRWQRRQSGMAQDAFYRLENNVQDLEFAFDGGRDGRDGRDSLDGRTGRDDGNDWGQDPGNDSGGGDDWGQNDDGGQGDGSWDVRH